MKKLLCLLLCMALLLCGCGKNEQPQGQENQDQGGSILDIFTPDETAENCPQHMDEDGDQVCDDCGDSVVVTLDIFGINDLHGKMLDGSSQPGVDELTTYLQNAQEENPNTILVSAGDMWQGSAESNITHGQMMTRWMNELGFDAMALGNHEFDWGLDAIRENAEAAQFPILAINVYDENTHERVPYCGSSVLVECDGLQVGIIGAVGDVYSSIASEKSEGVYFVVGDELTDLIREEAKLLQEQGAEFIILSIHDGLGENHRDSIPSIGSVGYYDTGLSGEYIDVVFEGHTHKAYQFTDAAGVYHFQHGGDNSGGISHISVAVNAIDGTYEVVETALVRTSEYEDLEPSPMLEELMREFETELAPAFDVLGELKTAIPGKILEDKVADLYYMAGLLEWGSEYDIVLGGGFISIREPGYLNRGPVTYADLMPLFPFDNELVLCSVSGRDLVDKFLETDNNRYHICLSDYGEQIRDNVDPNGTYYIVVDSYTSTYKPNNLTEVVRYTPGVYARDLLADFIANGGFN